MIVFFQELTSIGNRNRARTQAGAAERPSVERVQNSLTENEKRIKMAKFAGALKRLRDLIHQAITTRKEPDPKIRRAVK